jgi:hypothetical protein
MKLWCVYLTGTAYLLAAGIGLLLAHALEPTLSHSEREHRQNRFDGFEPLNLSNKFFSVEQGLF